ncbi:MAG: TIGR03086 family metal-binding protein [Nocardioidaceae bacterium]
MNPHEAFEHAMDHLQQVIDTVPDSRAERCGPTPCSEFTVDQLMDHILWTHSLLLQAAGGRVPAVAGTIVERHAAVAAASVDAWSSRGVEGIVQLTGELELPAAFALSLHTLEAFVHSWDLASAVGHGFAPEADLTSYIWEVAQVVVSDDARGEQEDAAFAPAVLVSPSETELTRLIAYTGRDPWWNLRVTDLRTAI